MDDAAREQLAQRLSDMSMKDARKEIRALDSKADMKFFRNAIWDEYHTLFVLPTADLSITLVEKGKIEDSKRTVGGGPRGSKAQKASYEYAGARVEPLTRPAQKRGSTGPSPFVRLKREQAQAE